MATISVIIPTWNRADTLARAIQSVLDQTLAPLEVLVCDDGSTDRSQQIVESFADDRVQWVPGSPSGGPATPRNRGIARSKGEWLAFLDSDDTWLPEKLAEQVHFLTTRNLLAVTSNGFRVVPAQPSVIFHDPARIAAAGIGETLTFETLLPINYVICSSAVVHRSLLEKTQGFPEHASLRAVEDYALWLRIAAYVPFGYLNQPLVQYRDTPDASIRKYDRPNVQEKKLKQVLENLLQWNTSTRALTREQVALVQKRIFWYRRLPLLRLYGRAKQVLRAFMTGLFKK